MKINPISLKVIILALSFTFIWELKTSNAQNDSIILHEGFEGGELPEGWTQEHEKGIEDWIYQDGGFSTSPGVEGSGHPPFAYQGLYNALFHYESFDGEKTKLVTPPMDLSFSIKPELIFYHTQDERYTFGDFRNDELRIYYRVSPDSSWTLLKTYTEVIEDWTRESLLLPEDRLSSTAQVAFEGKTNNGWGVALDSIVVIETGVISKYIEDIKIKQASNIFVATESSENPILQINFEVKGNDGDMVLDSLVIHSLNTNNSDIKKNGVRLFASNDTLFKNSEQIYSGLNFQNDIAVFDNLNYIIPRGFSSVWLTYDIRKDTAHNLQGHILDAKIKANHIKINNNYYPLFERSPNGSREIYESILFDDFEQDQQWTFTGEFERHTPQGLGGSYGAPDPTVAVSGDTIIGTDLSGQNSYAGDFEPGIPDKAYQAISPSINAHYYKDIFLFFDRWLNTTKDDHVYIDISTDNGNTWTNIWQNSGMLTCDNWTRGINYNINGYARRKDSINIRFALGSTNSYWNLSGWNIDNFVITGDYIAQDVGVTDWISPIDGCGHSDSDNITIKVKNFGGKPTKDTIPLSISIDGGTTTITDTIFQSISVGDSIIYTLMPTVDLSTPGLYEDVWARTTLTSDEANENNQYNTSLFIVPTYQPPYDENFEANYGYFSTNDNSIWEYGIPDGNIIDTASSGTKVWATGLSEYYNNLDSGYLETTCYNIAALRNPVFEMKLWSQLEEDKDGLALFYTIDNGLSWNIVPEEQSYKWNWYTSNHIEGLGTAGWDTSTTTWMNAKQLLPQETAGQAQIKFRLVMASDSLNPNEGVAIDDIRIYEAPPDVAVSSMPYPTTQCYLSDTVHTRVYIQNTGIDTLFAGQQIPLRLKVNDNSLIKDTLELENFLEPEDAVLFTFDQTVDMSDSGDYAFKVYAVLEDDPYFYDSINNDTLSKTIAVQGMPDYDIGNIIGVPANDSIDTLLNAGAGFAGYEWTGSNDEILGTGQNYLVYDTTGWFHIEVTNNVGCKADDSVRVVDSDINVGVTDTTNAAITYADSCERTVPVEIQVEVSNMGIRTFQIDDSIPMAYRINDLEPVHDTLVLEQVLYPNSPGDSTVKFTFEDSIDLSQPGNYTIKIYTDFPVDYKHFNDTLTVTLNTWGIPDTELAYDTLVTAKADTLSLDAGTAFDPYTYQWQDGSENQTFDISHNRSAWYKVTVTSTNGCGTDADSSRIMARNTEVDSLVYPASGCKHAFTNNEKAQVSITNHSADTLYPGARIPMALIVDSTLMRDTILISSLLTPGHSRTFTLSPEFDMSAVGEHSFEIYSESTFDVDRSNDTLRKTIETWGYPDVDFARDTVYTTKADTIKLFAGEGFGSYLWQDGSVNDTFYVSDKSSKQYSVTVTDVHGCSTDSDSVQVFTYNLGIKEMLAPSSDCELSGSEKIKVKVKNYSHDTLYAGDSLDIAYIMDETDTIRDTKTFSSNLLPGRTFSHTFPDSVDMSAYRTYQFEFFTAHPYDAYRPNDTLHNAVKTYGYPEFSLNYDTLYTTRADTVKLYPDITENAYLWSTGWNEDTLRVSDRSTTEYKLTVSDIHGCSSVDSSTLITYDLGVDSIISPVTQCKLTSSEPLTVEVKNYGHDLWKAGSSIPLGYRYNGGSVVRDTLTLSSDLPHGSTALHIIDSFDLSIPGSWEFNTFTDFHEDVARSNDSLAKTVQNYGYPVIDLGPDTLFTNRPDNVLLKPGTGFDSYLWQDGSTSETYSVMEPHSKQYHVTVTNTNGCSSYDTINIIATDLGIDSLISPMSGCERNDSEKVIVSVRNNSQDTLQTGDELTLSFSMGATGDTTIHTLEEDLLPNDTLQYTFARTIDMSAINTYPFQVGISYFPDVDISNNTLNKTLEVAGYPLVDIGPDTLFTTQADTLLLDAGSGHDSYLWQDGSSNPTFDVSSNSSALYHVRVSNELGCITRDSMQVIAHDVQMLSISSPDDACALSNRQQITVALYNISQDNLEPGINLPLNLIDPQGSLHTDTLVLSEPFNAGDTIEYSFSQRLDLSAPNTYKLKAYSAYEPDVNPSNDTTTKTIEVYGRPEPDLGDDATVYSTHYQLDPGAFAEYEWQDGSQRNKFTVSQNHATPDNLYHVKVTDQNGCIGRDTTQVVLKINDLHLKGILEPGNQCASKADAAIKLEVENTGNITLLGDTEIPFIYQIDDDSQVKDTMILNQELKPEATDTFTFQNVINIGSSGIFNVNIQIKLPGDLRVENNDSTKAIEIYPLPVIDFGDDTMKTAFPYTLDPGDFPSYLWHDGSSERTYEVTGPGTYNVEVSNIYGCTADEKVVIQPVGMQDKLKHTIGYEATIYPVPAGEHLMINLSADKIRHFTIKLINNQGYPVYNEKTSLRVGTHTIRTQDLPRGIYYLRIEEKSGVRNYKVILN